MRMILFPAAAACVPGTAAPQGPRTPGRVSALPRQSCGSQEQPSTAVKAKVERVLAERKWKIDAVLSHTVPLKYEPVEVFLSFIDQRKVDKSTEEWLDGIEKRLDYGHWYAGHYHTEKDIDRLSILFEGIREWK